VIPPPVWPAAGSWSTAKQRSITVISVFGPEAALLTDHHDIRLR
jgi:hypothetical protein